VLLANQLPQLMRVRTSHSDAGCRCTWRQWETGPANHTGERLNTRNSAIANNRYDAFVQNAIAMASLTRENTPTHLSYYHAEIGPSLKRVWTGISSGCTPKLWRVAVPPVGSEAWMTPYKHSAHNLGYLAQFDRCTSNGTSVGTASRRNGPRVPPFKQGRI